MDLQLLSEDWKKLAAHQEKRINWKLVEDATTCTPRAQNILASYFYVTAISLIRWVTRKFQSQGLQYTKFHSSSSHFRVRDFKLSAWGNNVLFQ